MDFDEAYEKWQAGEKSKEVSEVLLQDAYGFLESQNYHAHIEVIEELTGVEYD